MFAMFRQLFAALASFCEAAGLVGQSAVNLAKIGEEMSGTYLDETRSDRLLKAQERAAKAMTAVPVLPASKAE